MHNFGSASKSERLHTLRRVERVRGYDRATITMVKPEHVPRLMECANACAAAV